jgi:hypothetical protein
MNPTTQALSALERHLVKALEAVKPNGSLRQGDFDMDDEPEGPFLTSFPRLQEALRHLAVDLFPVWRAADNAALGHQRHHKLLARVVIGAGTSAIILAIIQMAVARQMPSLARPPLMLEIFAVAAGVVAVSLGLWTKGDRHWLCERNRAERLRMLKFKSLGWDELREADLSSWKNRVSAELDRLERSLSEEDVQQWTGIEHTGPDLTSSPGTPRDDAELAALQVYYVTKRIGFQSQYFEKRSKQHHAAARPWRHLSLPVFLVSTVCVLIHFTADWLLSRTPGGASESTKRFLEIVEVWGLALAAILPVVGLGIRVWLGAFEPHRSANLFSCKYRTVEDLRKRMPGPENNAHQWGSYVAETELFFENEHREWLRLMLETEWML